MSENKQISASEASRRMKKRIIIALVIIAAVFAVILATIAVLEKIQENIDDKKDDKYTGRKYTVIYHDPIDNIFKDTEYMSLDRRIKYYDEMSGITVALDDKSKNDYDPALALLYDYINEIIMGNAEGYNEFFSRYYYDADKSRQPKEHFHMQELYNITITKKADISYPVTEDGKSYEQNEYAVTFMIHKNNGSFMLIDSDAEKTEYYVITTISGDLKIDNIMSYKY